MNDKNLRRFHADRLQFFLRGWHTDGVPDLGLTAESIAYYLLEHGGMLYRYTGDDEVIASLKGLDAADRVALVQKACAYMRDGQLANQCRRVLGEQDPDSEQLSFLGSILVRRDGLETSLSLAREVAGELITTNSQVLADLAGVRCWLDELDKVLQEHQGVTRVACLDLRGLYAQLAPVVRQGLNLRQYWWFDYASFYPDEVQTRPSQARWSKLLQRIICRRRQLAGLVSASATDREFAALQKSFQGMSVAVAGDQEVTVAFDLSNWPDAPTRLQWRVWLVGPSRVRQRYATLVVDLTGGNQPLSVPLIPPGLALVPLDYETQRLLAGGVGAIQLKLVDQQGTEHLVE